jgi:hypothetical protein
MTFRRFPIVYVALTLLVRLASEYVLWRLEAAHYAGFEFLRLTGLLLVPAFILHAHRQKSLSNPTIAGFAALQVVIVLGFHYPIELITRLILLAAVLFGIGLGS